jgi:hypothetical protein
MITCIATYDSCLIHYLSYIITVITGSFYSQAVPSSEFLMSGFEVAGAVFAVIPLLIAGLEHYSHGVRAYYHCKITTDDFV